MSTTRSELHRPDFQPGQGTGSGAESAGVSYRDKLNSCHVEHDFERAAIRDPPLMLSRSGEHVMPERQYRIHPAIGIARVGDAARSDASNDFYFIGPEIAEFPANVDARSGVKEELKTPDGKEKPKAARFRIFKYEKENEGKFRPIGEVRSSDTTRAVKIVWTAHLANRKANFCAFHGQVGAEDNPLFSSYGTPGKPTVRNEKLKTNAERKKWLELDPGPQTVNGGDTVKVAEFAIHPHLKEEKKAKR